MKTKDSLKPDTKKKMPKHYSQKEAMGMADDLRELKESIDNFFDTYNDIRGQVEGLLESEAEVLKTILAALTRKDPVIDMEKTAAKIKQAHPEFFATWSEIERQRGQLEMIETVSKQLRLILRPEWPEESK